MVLLQVLSTYKKNKAALILHLMKLLRITNVAYLDTKQLERNISIHLFMFQVTW